MSDMVVAQDYAAEKALLSRLRIVDGIAYWTKSPRPRTAIGAQAGTVTSSGYVRIMYRRKLFMLHRLVFLAAHGYLPPDVDHIDGNPGNNRVDNLRAATRAQNLWNAKKSASNTSGVKNVSWSARDKRWIVRMRFSGKLIHIGRFISLDDAAAAAEQARNRMRGEFARHA